MHCYYLGSILSWKQFHTEADPFFKVVDGICRRHIVLSLHPEVPVVVLRSTLGAPTSPTRLVRSQWRPNTKSKKLQVTPNNFVNFLLNLFDNHPNIDFNVLTDDEFFSVIQKKFALWLKINRSHWLLTFSSCITCVALLMRFRKSWCEVNLRFGSSPLQVFHYCFVRVYSGPWMNSEILFRRFSVRWQIGCRKQ